MYTQLGYRYKGDHPPLSSSWSSLVGDVRCISAWDYNTVYSQFPNCKINEEFYQWLFTCSRKPYGQKCGEFTECYLHSKKKIVMTLRFLFSLDRKNK